MWGTSKGLEIDKKIKNITQHIHDQMFFQHFVHKALVLESTHESDGHDFAR